MLAYRKNPDATEEKLQRYLGGIQGLDYILQPDNPEELFDQLVKLAGERKVGFLIIAGHGGAKNPHIALGHRALVDRDVNLDDIEKALTPTPSLNQLENQLYDAPAGQRAALQSKVDKLLADRKKYRQQLARLDRASDVMADNAKVLLLNCSAAALPSGQQMCRNLARVLLGKRGGTLVASTVDIGIATMRNPYDSIQSLFRTGRYVDMGDTWVLGDWIRFNTAARKERFLFGAFHPKAVRVAAPNQDIEITPEVDLRHDSGKLIYFWDGSAARSQQASLVVPAHRVTGKRLDIKVRVQDEQGREASDTITLRIEGVEIEGPHQIDQGASAGLRAVYRPTGKYSGLRYRWQDTTENKDLGEGDELAFNSRQLGKHTVQAEAFSAQGKSMGTATHLIEVREAKEVEPNVPDDTPGVSELTISGPEQAMLSDFFSLEARSPAGLVVASYRWQARGVQDLYYLEKSDDPLPDAADLAVARPTDLNGRAANPQALVKDARVRFQASATGPNVFLVQALDGAGK
ncbi:MAG: hypothetical protein KC910_34035, partial [Candidatus Eremiobacteraeota bacterium]|nr:hypothetical protein [Candidatus Eremiobacteraeota bacterium]